MKIAVFCGGFYPVAEDTIKASEFFAYQLASELNHRGHEIHLFANCDSAREFQLHSSCFANSANNTINPSDDMYLRAHYVASDFVECLKWSNENDVDIIHDHTATFPLVMHKLAKMPIVSTLHYPKPPCSYSDFYKNTGVFTVTPSEALASICSDFKVHKVIPHGIDLGAFEYNETPEDYVVNIGRIVPEKGVIDAIKASLKAGTKIRVAGYLPDSADKNYYDEVINFSDLNDDVEFVGKIDRGKVNNFMKNAKALLFPTTNDEAFGLVAIEAMASGVPVIAYNNGALSEIVADRKTGFVVKEGDVNAMAEAINKIDTINRRCCREHVENKFSLNKMVIEYEKLFMELKK